MSRSKRAFDDSMDRCKCLVESIKSEPICADEKLRFSIVLAVAAFDSYVADRFSEHFVSFVKKYPNDSNVISFLGKISIGTKEVLSLLCTKKNRPFRTVRAAVDQYLSHQSFQSAHKVNDLFALYGLPKLFECAIQNASGRAIEMRVDAMIKRRHDIVHACDYDGRGRLRLLSIPTVVNWIKALKAVVDSMDQIVTNRFKSSGKKKVVSQSVQLSVKPQKAKTSKKDA